MDNVNDVLLDKLLKLTAEKAADEERRLWSKRSDMVAETVRTILGDKAAELALLPWEKTIEALEKHREMVRQTTRDNLSLSEKNVELAAKCAEYERKIQAHKAEEKEISDFLATRLPIKATSSSMESLSGRTIHAIMSRDQAFERIRCVCNAAESPSSKVGTINDIVVNTVGA